MVKGKFIALNAYIKKESVKSTTNFTSQKNRRKNKLNSKLAEGRKQ